MDILRREPLSISDDLLFTLNIDVNEKEVLEMLEMIHSFDPPGIGARDLNECLKIQLLAERKKLEAAGTEIPIYCPTSQINFGTVF